MAEKTEKNGQEKGQGTFTGRAKGGYQPLHEGYQPVTSKKGDTPQGQGQSTELPKPPKGGTGQSGGKTDSNKKS